MPDNAGILKGKNEQADLLERKRILIAEDDPQVRSVIANILKNMKAQVIMASDGVEAIEVLQNQHRKKETFDLALLDLMMPRMNGLGLLRYIRDSIHFHDLPVIIFSDVDQERELHECRCLGIDDFVPKPLSVKNLLTVIKSSIQARISKNNAIKFFEQEHEAILSSYGFPLMFGGFPMHKKYALRPSYYRCPFCQTTFTAPRLSNRALKPDYNDRLAIGLYNAGLEKNFLEFPLIEMIVCPECFYTSDRIGFMRIWTKQPSHIMQVKDIPSKEWEKVFFPLSAKLRKEMKIQETTRHNIVTTASGNGMGLFRLSTTHEIFPREHKDALKTIELATLCTDTLQKFFRGEPRARLQHKKAGYLLKKFYIYGLMNKKVKTQEEAKKLKQIRVKTMFQAMQALMAVSDIDFNVLEERMYCITRRFFLSDMLLPFVQNKQERDNMKVLRKKCVADMKITLIRARQAKSNEVKTIERFLQPLENRYYEIVKEEKKLKARAMRKQQ